MQLMSVPKTFCLHAVSEMCYQGFMNPKMRHGSQKQNKTRKTLKEFKPLQRKEAFKSLA